MQTIAVRPATTHDVLAVEALLESFDLPTAGVTDHVADFIVAADGGRIVAAAGIELYGTVALLRSVAVSIDYRSQGIARTLVEHLLDRARGAGVREVFLLTSTAADYFARHGFSPISDGEVDPAVRASKEFDSCCCAGAQAMHLGVS